MTATYDLTSSPQSGYSIAHSSGVELRKQVFDIAKLATHVAGDAVKILTINKGEFVKNVYVRNVTASTTGSSTLEVGDSGSATGYNASVDATAAANTVVGANGANIFTQLGSGTYAVTWLGGKNYTAADYILITLGSTAPANGVFEVIAEILPLSVYGATI